MALLRRLLTGVSAQSAQDQLAELYREIIRHEAKVGGRLFGEVPANRRREFFCLDEHTWVWHEEWTDQRGQHHSMTTRYDVRPHGVLKAQNGQPYRYIEFEEAKRLYQAVSLYNQHVDAALYAV